MRFIFALISVAFTTLVFGQSNTYKRVLFLGNSYTYVNDLPGLTRDLAAAAGDTLEIDSNTPGGYTLQMHCADPISTMKVQFGYWDYVVLQEQSQLPSFPIAEVDTLCFPFAQRLDSLVTVSNPCGETMFYNTWGRKNGDASNCANWPPVCTYQGMDSLLRLRYRMMADSNHAVISPVGAVWHYIRQHYPNIELYAPDESHPSPAGSYAAACTFYTCIFRKNPLYIPYDYTLNSVEAAVIRYAAEKVVYDSLSYWNIGKYDPQAGFLFTLHPNYLVEFVNTSINATHFYWDFGDGTTSYSAIVNHQYQFSGSYPVQLVASVCSVFDTANEIVNVIQLGIEENKKETGICSIFPNPAINILYISELDNILLGQSLQIINASGSLILERIITQPHLEIDIRGLSPGTYEVILKKGSPYHLSRKFVKK